MTVSIHRPRGARLEVQLVVLLLVLILTCLFPAAVEPAQAAAPPGTWSEITILGRDWPVSAYDPLRHRWLVSGGTRTGSGDTWSLSLDDPQAWLRFAGVATYPARDGASMIYDPVRDRMIAFGGHSDWDSQCASFDDLYALSLAGTPGWHRITVPGLRPPPRYQHATIYDPVGDRLIVVAGGETTGGTSQCLYFTRRYQDAWAFPLSTEAGWTELPQPPPEVEGPGISAIYDPAAERMVVFAPPRTFALDLASAAWSEIVTSGTAPGVRGRAVFDSAHRRALLFDGHDVWALDLASSVWSRLASAGSGPTLAGGPAVAYDASHDRLVVFGGYAGGLKYPDDTWSLSLGDAPTWSHLVRSPGFTSGHPMIFDPLRRRLVVFGLGESGTETWAMSLTGPPSWTVLPTVGEPPSPRADHTIIYDTHRDRLLLYGGTDSTGFLGDVWSLSLKEPPTWSLITGSGEPPPRRTLHVAAYDPAGDRMLVFGGMGYESNESLGMKLLDDAWQLSLASGGPHWAPIVSHTPAPPARAGAAGIFDPIRTRLVIVGGYSSFPGPELADTWALALAGDVHWSDLGASLIYPVAEPAAIYDPLRDRMVLFGGFPGYGSASWSLDLGDGAPAWSEVLVEDPRNLPSSRLGHTVAYDPAADRMLLLGGYPNYAEIAPWGEVWALTWDMPVPTQIALVSAIAASDRVALTWQCPDLSTSAILQRRPAANDWTALSRLHPDGTGRMTYVDHDVAAGGVYDYRLEVGTRAYLGEAHVEIPAAHDLAILELRPNPARGAVTIAFSLPVAGPATLELLDVAGRRVLSRSLGGLEPGPHQLDLLAGPGLGAGVYVARLAQGGRAVTRRVIVLH